MFQRCLSFGKLEHFGRHSSSFFGKKIFTWLPLLFPWSSRKEKRILMMHVISGKGLLLRVSLCRTWNSTDWHATKEQLSFFMSSGQRKTIIITSAEFKLSFLKYLPPSECALNTNRHSASFLRPRLSWNIYY